MRGKNKSKSTLGGESTLQNLELQESFSFPRGSPDLVIAAVQ